MLYVLDACSIIAFLKAEPGGDVVKRLLDQSLTDSSLDLLMHRINLLEIYYGFYRDDGKERATEIYNKIKGLPISFYSDVSEELLLESGRLKASYSISLADSIALGFAKLNGAQLVTSDHHEFDTLDAAKEVSFLWIRPK